MNTTLPLIARSNGNERSCPNCHGIEIETDTALGTCICISCGTVLEESTVVSELTFAELSNGASVLQGQFISADRGHSIAPSIFGRRLDRNIGSENTIQAQKKRIIMVAQAIGMVADHYSEAASRWYVLALQHQFTRGRRAPNIIAACLYIVSRQEKTPHMLLDFADVLQTSVYSLGGTFLRLVRLLNLEVPIIDPSFYVGRFASKMDFGDRTQQVTNTALRVVARMKRDWIQTGRRPAGVCAAGLIIAARMHGFRRTEKQVVKIVRICEATLKKRLEEFSETPSSQLTPEQFEGIWLEQESDPPAFTKNKGVFRKGEENRLLAMTPPYSQVSSSQSSLLASSSCSSSFISSCSPSLLKFINNEKDTLSDLDNDEEVDSCLLRDPQEIALKTEIWTSLNKDFLVKEAEKQAKEAALMAQKITDNLVSCSGPDGILTAASSIKKSTRISSKKKIQQAIEAANNNRLTTEDRSVSAAEATKLMLAAKKFSKRINYDVINELFT